MRLPKSLNILGKTIKVEYLDFDKILNCNNMNGNNDGNKQIIQIDSTLHREQQESVLLHEALHTISDSLNLDLSENVVRLLETGLYQLLNDNNLLKRR